MEKSTEEKKEEEERKRRRRRMKRNWSLVLRGELQRGKRISSFDHQKRLLKYYE